MKKSKIPTAKIKEKKSLKKSENVDRIYRRPAVPSICAIVQNESNPFVLIAYLHLMRSLGDRTYGHYQALTANNHILALLVLRAFVRL